MRMEDELTRADVWELEARFKRLGESVPNTDWKNVYKQLAIWLGVLDAFMARSEVVEQPVTHETNMEGS